MGILTPGSKTTGAKDMGETHAQLTVTNLFNKNRVSIRALVDTGAIRMSVTDEVARSLGFDPSECRTQNVRLADGRWARIPVIGPLAIEVEDRSLQGRTCQVDAWVMGDQCLLGLVPLELMDLMVDPPRQCLAGRHPEGPVYRMPYCRVVEDPPM